MKQHSRQELREAHQRLVTWLPQALEDAKDLPEPMELPALARATFGAATLDNLQGVLIYPAPRGGWHTDVLLKDMPPGISNVMGTPVQAPCPTREAAEAEGHKILASIVSQLQRTQEPAPPAFLLYGYTFPLIPELLEKAEHLEGYGSELRTYARLEEILDKFCPQGFDGEDFNDTWSDEQKARLLAVLHLAALAGVFRYPPKKDQAPDEHDRSPS